MIRDTMIRDAMIRCWPNSAQAGRDMGFTLVEVLISIFIFSLISIGSVSALTSALKGKARVNESLQTLSQLQQMRALVTADTRNLILRQNRDSLGGFDPVIVSGGREILFEFTRAGRENPGSLVKRSDLQRVFYVFEDGQFIRRVLSHENPTPKSITQERIFVSGLRDVDIVFHTGAIMSDQVEIKRNVFEAGENRLPDMIALTLTFENGDELTQYFGLNFSLGFDLDSGLSL